VPETIDMTIHEITTGLLGSLRDTFSALCEDITPPGERNPLPESSAEFILSRVTVALQAEAGMLFIQGDTPVHYLYVCGRGGGEGLAVVKDRRPSTSLAGWVAKHGEPVLTSGENVDAGLLKWPAGEDQVDMQDALCVPLTRDGFIYGALGVANKKSGTSFQKEDLERAGRIALPVAIFVSTLASGHRVHTRVREGELLAELGTSTDSMSPGQFAKKLAEDLGVFFSAETCCLYFLDEEQENLTLAGQHGEIKSVDDVLPTNGSGLAGAAFQGGIPIVVPDCLTDPRYDSAIDGLMEKPTSMLIQPLVREELSIGLCVLSRSSARPFTAGDLVFTKKMSQVATSARTQARCLERLTRTRQDLMLELQQAHQLQKKTTEFMSDLGASLRTPLFSMKATIELLREGVTGELNEHQQELAALLLKDIEKQDRSIFDLLVFTEIDRGRVKLTMVPANLGNVVREASESLQKQMEVKQIELVCDIQEGMPKLVADAERMKHVFINLLSNAFNWSPRGGRVEVEVTSDDVYATVRISDLGPGIPEEEREKIFDLFYQPDYEQTDGIEDIPGGRGLGLAIAKKVVDVHEGRITVKSEPGEGSVFEVRLPLVRGAES